MAELGREVTIYRFSIQGARHQTINVTMHYYRTVDLRIVVEEIVAHAEQAHLKGLTRGLIDGSYSFMRS